MDMKQFLISMGERIYKARSRKGYTQDVLSEIIGVSVQTISSAENGTKMLKLENLINLCKALNVSADYILFGAERREAIGVSKEDFDRMTPEQRENIKEIIDNCVRLCR